MIAAGGIAEPAAAQSWSAPFNHNTVHASSGVFTSPYVPWNGLAGSSAPLPSATFTSTVSTPSVVPSNVTYLDSVGNLVPTFHAGWPQPAPFPNGPSFEAVHMALAGKWTKMPPNPILSRRTYHSTAVLLPDGRVFLGGGDDRDYDYEIFSPAYLNAPQVRPVNPVWSGNPPALNTDMGAPELHYGQQYALSCDPLPLGHAIEHAALTAPCSVTHHSDMSQRYVELRAQVMTGNKVTFTIPADERLAPRGIYMLWLVTNTGTPSEAIWVVLR